MDHEIIQLDKIPGGVDLHAALKQVTNQSTVPNIFIGEKQIGGYDKLQILIEEYPEDFKNYVDLVKE